MDEQRLQAYAGLIKQLLDCSPGQEIELLQRNRELVDDQLWVVMDQAAKVLESRGDCRAGWMQHFPDQLMKLAEIGRQQELGEVPDIESSVKFLRETFLLITDSQGDSQQIYPVWTKHLEYFSSNLIPALSYITGQVLLSIKEEEQRAVAAAVWLAFGNLMSQFQLGTRWLNQEVGILAFRLALQVYNPHSFPKEWAMTQNNLVIAYTLRIQDNRSENLETAIAICQLVLQVITGDSFPKQWVIAQNNLAGAYTLRIQGDRSENLEAAITACEDALGVCTNDTLPEEWAAAQNNLANVYAERTQGDRSENLEAAITAYQCTLSVYTRDTFPREWARTQNNLANVYAERTQGDCSENLEIAIASYQLALQIRTKDQFPEQWATTQNNLAKAYVNRIQGDLDSNLKMAISIYDLALQVYTYDAFPYDWAMLQNNLAATYNVLKGDQFEYLEAATTAYQLSLQVYTPDTFPSNCRGVARNLGNLYFEQKNWSKAVSAYETALNAAENLYQACFLLSSQAAEIALTAYLPHRAAYTFARTDNYKKAVEVLEQSRARGLSEILDRDRTNFTHLQQIDPHLYEQYQNVTQQLRNLESQQRDRMVSADRNSTTPATLRHEAIRLRQQLTETINQIRQQPSHETFLRLLNFADVQQSANSACPLVYLLTTSAGSLALIVTPETTEAVWLDNFTEIHLTELLQVWFSAYSQSQNDRQAWYDVIDTTTCQLWEPLMEPLIRHLKAHNFNQATLIATGYLSLLPLHTAWIEDATRPAGKCYAFDEINFIYVPNAKSLTVSQSIADCVEANIILAIENPTQDLSNSEQEISTAIASFSKSKVLQQDEATITAVRSQLLEAEIAHFSCHGTANLSEPLNSGLLMSDGLLTLRDIFALNLAEHGGLRLVVLSACETGLSGTELVDEAVSLPTGLLQAGVAGVVASLWAVSDLSTMLLLTKFYDNWRNHQQTLPEALRQAQRWIRDVTHEELIDYYMMVQHQFTNPTEQRQIQWKIADLYFNTQNFSKAILIYQSLRETTIPDDPEFERLDNLILQCELAGECIPLSYPFAHPYHWAAFQYVGV